MIEGRTSHPVTVENLTIGYPTPDGRIYEAIREANWKIGENEFWGVLGESGSGKTTLLTALAGLNAMIGATVIQGAVKWYGTQQGIQPGKFCVFLPQGSRSAIYPLEQIGNQIEQLLSHAGSIDAVRASTETQNLLMELSLTPSARIASSLPGKLSGGMRQRAALALALARNPKVILLDEPVAGLDMTTEAQVCRLLSRICLTHRTTIVAIMHNLVRASQFVSHLAVLHQGRLIETGPVEKVLSRPENPYVQHIVAEAERTSLTAFSALEALPRRSAEEGIWVDTVPLNEPSVVVSGLKFSYSTPRLLQKVERGKPVLTDITFRLFPTSITGLVGESGSGKTTLAKCLNGLLSPKGDCLEVCDFNLLKMRKQDQKRALRAIVQLVFQESEASFDPRWKLFDSIREPVQLHGLSRSKQWKDEMTRLMDAFGLPDRLLSKRPNQVSGGELQRLAIIRALLIKPKLLIADEPFSALDFDSRTRVLQELRRLCGENSMTLLLITHDISLAKTICDYIMVLLSGVLVETGSAEQVGTRTGHPYTRSLISSVPVWRQPLPSAKNHDEPALEGVCSFFSRCDCRDEQCKEGHIPKVEVSPGHWVSCIIKRTEGATERPI